MDPLHEAIATVIVPRFPLGYEGLDFGGRDDRGELPLPGGFCCFQVDLPDSLERVAELRARRGRGRLPFVCADLERGAGHYIRGLTRLPPALALGCAADPGLSREAGALTGREALRAGVTFVFAPVLDVACEPENPIVATRAFAATADLVARIAVPWIEGAAGAGVLPTAKHYPGHGATRVDSHLELPRIDVPLDLLLAREELPFRSAIAAGCPAIMAGHLAVPALDPDSSRPASLSPRVLAGRLRGELGFRGVIATDALDMGAIAEGADAGPLGDPAVRAIQAGADMALLPRDPSRSARNLLAAVLQGSLPRERVLEAAARLARLAGRTAVPERPEFAPDPVGRPLARRIARAALVAEPADAAVALVPGSEIDVALVDDGRGADALPRLLARLAAAGFAARHVGVPAERRPGAALAIAVAADVRAYKGRVMLDAERAAAARRWLASGGARRLLSIGCPQATATLGAGVPALYACDDDDASLEAIADALAGALAPAGRRAWIAPSEAART